MWKSPSAFSTDSTSPTNTIGVEAKAWQGVSPPLQLQAAAGRGLAARNPAARRNARTQDEGRICLLNDGPGDSCTVPRCKGDHGKGQRQKWQVNPALSRPVG